MKYKIEDMFDRIMHFRDSLNFGEEVPFGMKPILHRMMDAMVLLALGKGAGYTLPPLAKYMDEYPDGHNKEVSQFHKRLIECELEKLGWKYDINVLTFIYDEKEELEGLVSTDRFMDIVEAVLENIEPNDAECVKKLLVEASNFSWFEDSKQNEIMMIYMDEIFRSCVYIKLEGPPLRPEILRGDYAQQQAALERLLKLQCIFDYTNSTLAEYDEKKTCLHMIAACYQMIDDEDFDVDDELFFFPGVILYAKSIQDLLDDGREEGSS